MCELDKLDLRILKILQSNAWISISEIAKRLNTPNTTVRYRIERLIRNGVIKKIAAILDPVKVGYPITLIILLKVDRRRLDQIFDKISKFKELHHLFQITGRYDLIAILHARDMDHLNELNNEIRKISGVKEAETLIATKRMYIKSELYLDDILVKT